MNRFKRGIEIALRRIAINQIVRSIYDRADGDIARHSSKEIRKIVGRKAGIFIHLIQREIVVASAWRGAVRFHDRIIDSAHGYFWRTAC